MLLENLRIKIFFMSIILIPLFGFSQFDTTYFKTYNEKFALKFTTANKFASVLYENLLNEVTYDPNRPISVGLGFNYKKMGMSFSYGMDFLTNEKKGKTESFDIQYHNYGNRFNFDIIGQVYKGFYNDDSEQNDNYEVHGDLKAIKFGFFGQYIFNSSKFSYNAAFSQRGRQLKSAGSFLLGGGFYYSQIFSDLPDFFIDSTQVRLTNIQMGTSIGYAYTWAFTKNFNCSVSIAAGFNGGMITTTKQFMIYPTTIPRFSIGYNWNLWSFYINYVNNLIYIYYSQNMKIALSSGEIQLSVIKRFEKIPFFK